jgi:hypothetical protein
MRKRSKKYRRAKGGPNRLDVDETPTLLAKIMPTVLRGGDTHTSSRLTTFWTGEQVKEDAPFSVHR